MTETSLRRLAELTSMLAHTSSSSRRWEEIALGLEELFEADAVAIVFQVEAELPRETPTFVIESAGAKEWTLPDAAARGAWNVESPAVLRADGPLGAALQALLHASREPPCAHFALVPVGSTGRLVLGWAKRGAPPKVDLRTLALVGELLEHARTFKSGIFTRRPSEIEKLAAEAETVAHDLHALLGSITLGLRKLRREAEDSDAVDVRDATERALELLSPLLSPAGAPHDGDLAMPALLARRARALLVEDNPGVRRVAQRVLESAGYDVLVAPSGEEGLEICAQHGPELAFVLTDVAMPGIDGRTFAFEVRRTHPELPFVFMSGHASSSHVLEGLASVGWVSKPFSPSRLLEEIRTVLGVAT